MNLVSKLLKNNPFNFKKSQKKIFLNEIKRLNKFHLKNCNEYGKFIKFTHKLSLEKDIYELPFIPARIFKLFNLKSLGKNLITKKLVSSGTSGINSQIFLGNENALNQTKVLNQLFKYSVTPVRLPMLILEQSIKTEDKNILNAKSAAINGFSIYGKDHTFAINEKNGIDFRNLDNFLSKYRDNNFLIFGFTSSVYNFFNKLDKKKYFNDFKNSILFHGGGWKKLEHIKISNAKFKSGLFKNFKIEKIINYYGMVEQTGSIFFECENNYFHTSVYSDIIIRDQKFNVLKNKNRGLVQLISILPTSYPGHNILTEDIGEIIGENNCRCGRKGKYFKIHGRAKGSELRGCSNL